MIEPHPASIQDRDGGGLLLQASRRLLPFIERVFADGGYAGERIATATRIIVEIVAKSPDQIGFAVLPRRWVVSPYYGFHIGGRSTRFATASVRSSCGIAWATGHPPRGKSVRPSAKIRKCGVA